MDINRAIITSVFTNHQALGLAIPPKIKKAEADRDKLTNALAGLKVNPEQIATAVADAILSGKDPATDPEVNRLITTRQLATDNTAPILAEAETRYYTALREARNELIPAWQEAFREAADTILKERQHLGDVDLTKDADAILNRGGDIAEHFTAARDANAACTHAADALRDYTYATGGGSQQFPPRWKMLLISPVTLEQWEQHQLSDAKLSAWDAAGLGLTLELADLTEFRARLAAHEATRQHRITKGTNTMSGKSDTSFIQNALALR